MPRSVVRHTPLLRSPRDMYVGSVVEKQLGAFEFPPANYFRRNRSSSILVLKFYIFVAACSAVEFNRPQLAFTSMSGRRRRALTSHALPDAEAMDSRLQLRY